MLSCLKSCRIAQVKRHEKATQAMRAVVGTLDSRSKLRTANIADLSGHSWATIKTCLDELAKNKFVEAGRLVSIPPAFATYNRKGVVRVRYFSVPALIEPDEPFSLVGNRLLWLIFSFCKNGGVCRASIKGLANMIGCTRPTIEAELSRLEQSGHVVNNLCDRRPNIEAMMGILNVWESSQPGLKASEVYRWHKWLREFFAYLNFIPHDNLLNAIMGRWPCRKAWQTEQEWAELVGRVMMTAIREAMEEGTNPAKAVLGRLARIPKIDYGSGAKYTPTTITPIEILELLTPEWLDQQEKESRQQEARELAEYEDAKQPPLNNLPASKSQIVKAALVELPDRTAKAKVERAAVVRTVYEPVFRETFAKWDKGERDMKTVNVVWYLCHRLFREEWECNEHHRLTHFRNRCGRTVTGDEIADAQDPDVWALFDELDPTLSK